MRATRLVTVLITLAMLALVPVASSSAVAAATTGLERVDVAARVAAEENVTARVVRRKREGLFFIGGVESGRGPVYVQMATTCDRETGTCNFRFYRKLSLTKGRYETKISAPTGLEGFVWRAKVRSTFSDTWLTCTKTRRQVERDVPCKLPS